MFVKKPFGKNQKRDEEVFFTSHERQVLEELRHIKLEGGVYYSTGTAQGYYGPGDKLGFIYDANYNEIGRVYGELPLMLGIIWVNVPIHHVKAPEEADIEGELCPIDEFIKLL